MTKRPVCPRCQTPDMQRIYIRTRDENKLQHFDGIGWMCRNPACNFLSHD